MKRQKRLNALALSIVGIVWLAIPLAILYSIYLTWGWKGIAVVAGGTAITFAYAWALFRVINWK